LALGNKLPIKYSKELGKYPYEMVIKNSFKTGPKNGDHIRGHKIPM